jgi:hypothetical protein
MAGNAERLRCRRGRIVSSGLAGGLVLAAFGCGGKVAAYSATQVTTRGGHTQQTSKVFVAGQKMRMEMPHPSGHGSLVSIVRQDRGVAWMLFPEQRMYREVAIDEADLTGLSRQIKDDQVIEELGSETVAGYSCRKVKVRTKVTVMGRTIESTSTVWMTPKLGLPLRSEHSSGTVSELRDITEGRQPADLFEVPAGFSKTESMFPGLLDQGREDRQGDRHDTSLADKIRKLAKRP